MSQTFTSIPTNHLLAVLGPTKLTDALHQLEGAGFSDLVVYRGDDVTKAIDPKGEAGNPVGKAVRAVQDHFSEELNYLSQYQEEARAGNPVIAVAVEGPEQSEPVRTVLERNGARNIRFFGRLATTDLSPETNPSSRSADSPEAQKWDTD